MSANAAAENRGLFGNMTYTSAGNVSGKLLMTWALRNIRR